MKRGPGRPPRAAKPSLGRIEIRVTDAEKRAWEKRAEQARVTLSQWVRARCNQG